MIISVMNQKGGCGKTVTAVSIASVLRSMGKTALLVDLDPQASLSMLLNLDDSRTIADVLKGTFHITDVVQTVEFNGDAVAGSAELPLLSEAEMFRLKAVLKEIEPYYDYLIIDSTPSLSAVGMAILNATNKLIIPSLASLPSLLAIRQFGNMITVAKQSNPSLEVAGVLLVMYDKRSIVTRAMKETAEEVAKKIGTNVFDTCIRKGVAVEEALASFKGLIEYAPNSNPAIDYINFVKELGV
jgi:chromosome partitioning protein